MPRRIWTQDLNERALSLALSGHYHTCDALASDLRLGHSRDITPSSLAYRILHNWELKQACFPKPLVEDARKVLRQRGLEKLQRARSVEVTGKSRLDTRTLPLPFQPPVAPPPADAEAEWIDAREAGKLLGLQSKSLGQFMRQRLKKHLEHRTFPRNDHKSPDTKGYLFKRADVLTFKEKHPQLLADLQAYSRVAGSYSKPSSSPRKKPATSQLDVPTSSIPPSPIRPMIPSDPPPPPPPKPAEPLLGMTRAQCYERLALFDRWQQRVNAKEMLWENFLAMTQHFIGGHLADLLLAELAGDCTREHVLAVVEKESRP
jgi:hypothetical protein